MLLLTAVGGRIVPPCEREGSSSPRFGRSRGGIRGGDAVAIVWPCRCRSMPTWQPAAGGGPRRTVVVRGSMVRWAGYRRYCGRRAAAGDLRTRLRCGRCGSRMPAAAFVLAGRLDVVEMVGGVIGQVVDGQCGARPAAARAVAAHHARGWLRRFRDRAVRIGVAFAALAVELAGDAVRRCGHGGCSRSPRSGRRSPRPVGCRAGRRWGCAVRIGGGRREADHGQHDLAYLIVGSRRFMPPIRHNRRAREDGVDHKQQEQVALHRWAVIAEAANERLSATERGVAVRQIAARAHTHPDGSTGGTRGPRSTGGCGPGARTDWRRFARHRGRTPGRSAPTRSCSPRPAPCGWNYRAARPRRSPRSCGTATASGLPSEPSVPSCAAPGCTARRWPPSRRLTAGTRPRDPTNGGSPMCWWVLGALAAAGRLGAGPTVSDRR